MWAPACVCMRAWDLVEDVDVVVGQVEEHQPPQAPERPLLHRADVAALQGQVRQVGSVLERPRGQLLDVIPSQVQLHCDLVEEAEREKERERGRKYFVPGLHFRHQNSQHSAFTKT